MTGASKDDPSPLEISRIFHASREQVFAAWCSAEHVTRWFSPEGCTVAEVTVEPRVGGRFELTMRSPAGEHRLRGKFVEMVPQTRLVIDIEVSDAAGHALFAALTEVDFRDALAGTEVAVTQRYRIIDPAAAWMAAGAPDGWRSTLDKLAALLGE